MYHGKYPRVLPSKAFCDYEKDSLKQLQFFRKRAYVSGPVIVRCRYYMPNERSWPDLVGLLQATSDILTTAKIIDDDMWIVNYDGSKIVGVDKYNPRTEIEIVKAEEHHILHDIWGGEINDVCLFLARVNYRSLYRHYYNLLMHYC